MEILNIYRATLIKDGNYLSMCTVSPNREEAKRNFLRDFPDYVIYELFLTDGDEPTADES